MDDFLERLVLHRANLQTWNTSFLGVMSIKDPALDMRAFLPGRQLTEAALLFPTLRV
jgi:hypothetical protein